MTDIVERLNDSLSAGYSELRKEAAEEILRLRAKAGAMERQEPIGVLHVGSYYGEELEDWEFEADQRVCDHLNERHVSNPTSLNLYTLPGAQLAPNAIAYLDLGAGGYMDIGTDLTDEALAAIPKGRHRLGIIGTYGVDGYLPAQPAPSVSDGWKEAAIAWEVCGSLHREYAKGKDPFFKKRQEDFVKHANDARTMLAAPEAKPASSFADAYQGAMEEVAIWEKRALEAEDLNRKFVAEINGPTYMGEPVHSKPDCGEAGHDEGRCGNRRCLPCAKGEEK